MSESANCPVCGDTNISAHNPAGGGEIYVAKNVGPAITHFDSIGMYACAEGHRFYVPTEYITGE